MSRERLYCDQCHSAIALDQPRYFVKGRRYHAPPERCWDEFLAKKRTEVADITGSAQYFRCQNNEVVREVSP